MEIFEKTEVAPREAEEGKLWFTPREMEAAACDEEAPVTRTVEDDTVWGET